MTRHGITLLAAILVAAGGIAQQDTKAPPPGQKAPAPEPKKAAAPKKIDARFKVLVEEGGERPQNLRIEISGQESACGSLTTVGTSAAVDEHGEALFKDLPVCKITVKINANRFLPLRLPFDLATYKAPISLTLQPEK
jgi:hypothetical protein